jgi:acyl-CoA thioesterase-1
MVKIEMEYLLILFVMIGMFAISCTSKEQTASKEVVSFEAKKEETSTKTAKSQKTILCFGNSLTAGYGLDENKAWPYLLQQKLSSLDLPYSYSVVNAGLSGETSAGGLGRIDWVLNQHVDIFILELGANDMLRGLDVTETRKNLSAILDKVKLKYPDVQIIIAGLYSPPNMGTDYEKAFNKIYPELAQGDNSSLIPFFLNNVAQIDSLNLSDGKHPNEKGQVIVMANIWETLKELI